MIEERVRIHLFLPKRLVKEIDEAAGPRRRSEYVAELVEREARILRRQRIMEEFRKNPPGRWGAPGEEDMDAAEWVDLDRRRGDRIDELWGPRGEV